MSADSAHVYIALFPLKGLLGFFVHSRPTFIQFQPVLLILSYFDDTFHLRRPNKQIPVEGILSAVGSVPGNLIILFAACTAPAKP